jgi:microcystin-dependent protein
MATTLNAGTTTGTALNVITDTTGAMAIQTSGTTAISISAAQAVTLTNPLPIGSGGTGSTTGTGTGTPVFATSPTLTGTPLAPTAAAGTNTTQIATTAFVTQNAVLTGALLMWPTAAAPSGYLLCDGTAVSRTTYASLFAIVGSTFGAGDGSTTFNLPNYVNRMPIGVGSTAALAATGGSKDAVVVSHTHTASSTTTATDSGHYHTGSFMGPDYNAQTGRTDGAQATNFGNTDYGYANITASTSTTVNAFGVSGTNANLPPYLGINFIIKT